MANNISRPPLPFKLKGHEQIILSSEGKRHDDRGAEEIREMYTRQNSIESASGSAYFALGHTKVHCAVYGPRPIHRGGAHEKGEMNIEYKIAPFARNRRTAPRSTDERDSAQLLLQAFESVVLLTKYPKSVIDIYVLIIEDDGGALTAALTCVGLALAHAGIELMDVVAAATIFACPLKSIPGHNPHDNQVSFLVDLDTEEEIMSKNIKNSTIMHLGFCPSRSAVCFLHALGPQLNETHNEQLFNLGEAVCCALGEELRNCLKASFIKKGLNSSDQFCKTD